MSIKPTYIDLFCGAGGLSLGFDEAGFQNVFSIEYNPVFAETYKKNFPKHNLIVDDIRNLSLEKIKTLIGNNQIDVVIGGSPCQGFSKAGNIGRQFLEDERNYLFKEFVRVVDVVKPKYLLFENVSALYTHNKGKTINEIINEFERIGYPFSSFALLLLCVFALTPLRSPSHFLIFSFSFLLFCSFALCRACVKSLSLKRSFAHIHTSAKARLYSCAPALTYSFALLLFYSFAPSLLFSFARFAWANDKNPLMFDGGRGWTISTSLSAGRHKKMTPSIFEG